VGRVRSRTNSPVCVFSPKIGAQKSDFRGRIALFSGFGLPGIRNALPCAVDRNRGSSPKSPACLGFGCAIAAIERGDLVSYRGWILILLIGALCVPEVDSAAKKCARSCSKDACRHDIVNAVGAAAAKDCGCGSCAAKGCDPCHGKNCYYCVAKSLVANDCGCKSCTATGCKSCGPGCDVCKFHLAHSGDAPDGKSGASKPSHNH